MKTKLSYCLCLLVLSLVFACRKNEINSSETKTSYILEVPNGFPLPILSNENPLSKEGIYLGRKLYYDSLLSYNGPMQGKACASCHLQSYGFIIPDIPVLAHVNLAWNTNFLWKGNINGSLEDIMMFEVNDFFQTDLQAIMESSNYRQLYESAFGDENITTERTAFALAQFMRTLVSGNSVYDRFLNKKGSLNASEERGYRIFFSEKGDCFHCHGNALFTDNAFHNIGLLVKSSSDMGRYLITGAASDIGKFKTPTLRNSALRNVYMHDGRFKTLKEVITHYNSGIMHSEYLDPLLDKAPLGLNNSEIDDLVSFLESLTDSSFINNSKFSKPK